eukprot:TRINITY_DN8386_c0_g1_i3.p2 TRINITY_DN8386_c0_g1~~TRINITY_DN8386_c0_g1_i3.p2  ORF type:complete len:118 (-),score=8.83 TRINITY_DN8386_c0_g1_i3:91-444(-)
MAFCLSQAFVDLLVLIWYSILGIIQVCDFCNTITGFYYLQLVKRCWSNFALISPICSKIKAYYGKNEDHETNETHEQCIACLYTVSYTHLTLPTICSVQISVVAVSVKKKNKQHTDE